MKLDRSKSYGIKISKRNSSGVVLCWETRTLQFSTDLPKQWPRRNVSIVYRPNLALNLYTLDLNLSFIRHSFRIGDGPSAVPVTTHLSTLATLNQPKIDSQAGGSSSRMDNQSSTQTTVGMGLKPQLFVSGNRVVYPASFSYGQWPNHVGATPYGVSAVQNSLPFPYSAYYGLPANPMVAGSGSHQNHSYGQQQSYTGSTVMGATQLQGSNSTDQAMSSTTKSAEASSHDTASVFHLSHATTDRSSIQSNTAQGMQALQPSALLNGQNPVWDATADDSTMVSRGLNQPPEPSTIDPSTLSLEPAQLAEILRANPGLASVVLAALGQTQSRV